MRPQELRSVLRELALRYAKNQSLPVDASHSTAVLFKKPGDNLHLESFKNIQRHDAWLKRTEKAHQNVQGMLEMSSSNSSDALLMTVFCNPDIVRLKGLKDLLGVSTIVPTFGFKAAVKKNKGKDDATEIDMVLEGVFVEAKLTETDFKQKRASVVGSYDGFAEYFHRQSLARSGDLFDNYQIIRNLLAAIQHNRQHILLCDERRPDLVRRYMETVCCLRNVDDRKRCRVIFWQEVCSVCGKKLRGFLEQRYGL
jgi:hypothetical protein